MSGFDAITEFESKVSHLYEAEYGDFKRKLGLYLRRLEQDLGEQLNREKKAALEELKHQIIYTPETTDIEAARRTALNVVARLR